MRSKLVSSVTLWAKPHLIKSGDWSQVVFTRAIKVAFISKTQFNPIKLHVHVYLSDINYFNKVISDCW